MSRRRFYLKAMLIAGLMAGPRFFVDWAIPGQLVWWFTPVIAGTASLVTSVWWFWTGDLRVGTDRQGTRS